MKQLKKYFPSGSFLAIILCFFLPFVVVKCNGNQFMTATGFKFVTGGNFDSSKGGSLMSKGKQTDNTKIDTSIYLILLLITTVLAFGLSLSNIFLTKKEGKELGIPKELIGNKNLNKIFLGASLFSLILVVTFVIDGKTNGSGKIPEEMKQNITIEAGSGLQILIFLIFINILYFGNELGLFDKILKKGKKD
ncbi:hypothetical protein BKN14_00665 [Candidatus Gracilibacteria bacterium HOT-871]|nr:hypothetical protein BKN14_00665 [Candidatus Gracilibacteria bacterium HOT-871]